MMGVWAVPADEVDPLSPLVRRGRKKIFDRRETFPNASG
jgi:hypothetical protein